MTMTTTTMTRRTALLGSVTLPAALAPVAALATGEIPQFGTATAANATDAAWAELQAAEARVEALSAKSDAFDAAREARLPAHLKKHTRPDIYSYDSHVEFKRTADAWNAGRNNYGVDTLSRDGGPLEQAYDGTADAELAVLAVPAVTMVDVERKLIVAETVIGQNGDEGANAAVVRDLLADVRRLNGRSA